MKAQFTLSLSFFWKLLPRQIKSLIRKIKPIENAIRSVVNTFVPVGLTEVKIIDGNLRDSRMILDLKREKYYWLGDYELDLQEAISQHVLEGMITYDVGANIGFTSLLLSKAVGENGKVFAFEPLPENIGRLRKNLALNGLDHRVVVIEAAVVEIDSEINFLVHGQNEMGCVPLERTRDNLYGHTIQVTGISLDNYVYYMRNPPPDFIKIDVEGGELKVIKGGLKVLDEFRPIVILEAHKSETLKEILEITTALNYRAYNIAEEYSCIKISPQIKQPVRILIRYDL